MNNISIFGTSSDAGKSTITFVIAKILQDLGFSVAPFKAQNVSNNSHVCDDGSEIAIAQYFQAEVLGVETSYHLNPVLLKSGRGSSASLIVEGKVVDEIEIDKPILTTKDRGMAKSKIDLKKGKPAKSTVSPILVEGNKSKIKVVIESGRTHQIRVHLNSVGLPIIGDAIYGRTASNINRVLLHSKVTKIFDYVFESKEPKEFRVYDFHS